MKANEKNHQYGQSFRKCLAIPFHLFLKNKEALSLNYRVALQYLHFSLEKKQIKIELKKENQNIFLSCVLLQLLY